MNIRSGELAQRKENARNKKIQKYENTKIRKEYTNKKKGIG